MAYWRGLFNRVGIYWSKYGNERHIPKGFGSPNYKKKTKKQKQNKQKKTNKKTR